RLDNRGPQARRGLQGSEGRRLDGLRLLDLFGRFPRTGKEQGQRSTAQWSLRARLGIRVAVGPPHPLQPGIGAPRRQALEPAKEANLVGREERGMDRLRYARLHQDEIP